MGECPLCGESTNKTSSRLIKDACGHTKCRLCLLQEENGCRICENNSYADSSKKIDSIGNFDYPLPSTETPNFDYSNCEPCELTVNEIPNDIECDSLPIKKNIVINKGDSEDVQKSQSKDKESIRHDNNIGNNDINEEEIDDENVQIVQVNQRNILKSVNNQNKENRSNQNDDNEQKINENQSADSPLQTTENNSQLNHNITESINEIDNPSDKSDNSNNINTISTNLSEKSEQYQKKKVDCNQASPHEHGAEESSDNFAHSDTPIDKQSSDETNSSVCAPVDKNLVLNQIESVLTSIPEYQRQPHNRTLVLVLNSSLRSLQKPIYPSFQQILARINSENTTKNVECNQNNQTNSIESRNSSVLHLKSPSDQSGSSQPSKSPVQYVGCRSLDNRLSDSIFKKQNTETECDKKVASPAQSIGYKSPEYSLSDYLVFNKKSLTEIELAERENLDNGKETTIESSSNNDLLINKQIVERNKETENEKGNSDASGSTHFEVTINTKISSTNKIDENIDIPVESAVTKSSENLEQLNSSDEIINRLSNNFKNINCPLLKKKIKAHEVTADKIEENQSKRLKEKNDENKKNKAKFRRKKKVDKHSDKMIDITVKKSKSKSKQKTKLELKSKTKHKITNNQNLKCQKLSTRSTKRKVAENEDSKNIEKTGRGQRNKKPKLYISENDDAEPPVKRKRGRPSKDWSHIVELPGSPTTYKCTVCTKTFKVLRSKIHHSACRTGKVAFECKECERTFAVRSHYDYHVKTHAGEKPFKCDICDKSFVQKHKLNRHKEIHKRLNDLECDDCGRTFKTKQYLKNHMLIHQENEFKCKYCPKIFTLANNRKRHELLTHLSVRSFKCDVCSTSFKCKFLLTRHKRIHGKSRPFSCEICKKVFLSKHEVKRHMTSHSEAKPYQCKACGVRFRRKDNLNRHTKHHHMNDESHALIAADEVAEDKQERQVQSEIEQRAKMPSPKQKPFRAKRSTQAVPISLQLLTSEGTETSGSFTTPISHQKVLDLNRQIEAKISQQAVFCDFPGLKRVSSVDSSRRRESCDSNTNSIDASCSSSKPKSERFKNKQSKKKEQSNAKKNENVKMRKDINIHWRRGTAESLKPKHAS